MSDLKEERTQPVTRSNTLALPAPWLLAALFTTVTSAQDATRSTGWVAIPVSEYATLHVRAFPSEREPDPLLVEATLTRVEYDLQIKGRPGGGQARLTVDVFKGRMGARSDPRRPAGSRGET